MSHYEDVEWNLYKKKVISKEKSRKMEEHLYSCNECMNTFLSLINNEEVYKAEKILSEDFTSSVINSIQRESYRLKSRGRNYNERFKNIFGYYVAVAAVTIILTWGGFYSGIVEVLPQITKSTVTANFSNKTNIVSNVSEKIVNKTSIFINDFEIFNPKEGLRK